MTLPLIFDHRDVARFLSYVEPLRSGCWFWSGARSRGTGNKKWYGSFWLPAMGMSVRAHRFSCEAIGGRPPLLPGQHRSHSCDFSLCVCPECIDVVPREVNDEHRLSRGAMTSAGFLSYCIEKYGVGATS